ncbi:MAG: choice-of-anchor J domain-containing protein [Flavobacterium sp.]|nr:choice-of-anchor J domain-containing protein [Flavobacterium sp.]
MKKITFLLFLTIFSNAAFAQFTEDFESSADIPSGWTVVAGGDEENTWAITDLSEYGLTAHSGNNAATIFYSADAHDDYLVTPAITVVAGVNDYFSFWARSLDVDYPEEIDVVLSTTGTDAGNFTVTLQASVAPESGETYYKYAYDLSAYVGQTVYIGFHSITADMDIFEVDDVVSTAIPSCYEPTTFAVDGTTTTSADLSWTYTTGTSFEIEYGPEGFVPGTGTVVTASAPPLTLNNLTPSTTYDAYIKNNCGGNGLSTALMVSFSTPAVPPANDTCVDAIALTVGGDFEGSALEYTDTGATTDADVAPECQSFYTNDVWFTVVVPADGNLTLETAPADGSDNDDTIIGVFSGECGSLTAIDCNDDNEDPDNDGFFSKLVLTGLTPGDVLHVAVWQYYFDLFGDPLFPGAFRVAAYSETLSVGDNDLSQFKYYPNPVKDVMNLSYTQSMSDVKVFNMLGQQVFSKSVNATSTQLDLSTLSTGTYVVKVTSGNEVKTIKIAKE